MTALGEKERTFYQALGQFTRTYTQTVKRTAENKRRYATLSGSIPPVLLSGLHDFACKVYFDDKRRRVDLMITTVAATSDSLNIT